MEPTLENIRSQVRQVGPVLPEDIGALHELDSATRYLVGREVLPSLVFKAPELFSGSAPALTLNGSWPGEKYLRFFLSMHHPARRAALTEHFPLQADAQAVLGKRNARSLIVVGEQVGMGDELCDATTLLQALVDFNPYMEIVCLTTRPHLYNHPQIMTGDWRDAARSYHDFNLVVDCGNVGPYWSPAPEGTPPEIFVRPRSIRNAHPLLVMRGQQTTLQLPLNNNVYMPGFMLCAEFGLPFRWGTRDPLLSVFVGNPNTEEARTARHYWHTVVMDQNKEGRPIAIFNPFGGAAEEKGYLNSAAGDREASHALELIIDQGYLALIIPNETPWGTVARAQRIAQGLPPFHAIIAPPPQRAPTLTKYLVANADSVFTCEGGLVHLSYHLGVPFRVLLNDAGRKAAAQWVPAGNGVPQGTVESVDDARLPPRRPLLQKSRAVGANVQITPEAFNSFIEALQNNKYAVHGAGPYLVDRLLKEAVQPLLSAHLPLALHGRIRHVVRHIATRYESLHSGMAHALADKREYVQEHIPAPLLNAWGEERRDSAAHTTKAYTALSDFLAAFVGACAATQQTRSGQAIPLSPRSGYNDPFEIFSLVEMSDASIIGSITEPILRAEALSRLVLSGACQIIWHFESALDQNITPRRTMSELLPLYAQLAPALATLADTRTLLLASTPEAPILSRLTEALCAGGYVFEEGMEKEPALPELLLHHKLSSADVLAKVGEELVAIEQYYGSFLDAWKKGQRSPFTVIGEHSWSAPAAHALMRMWVPAEMHFPWRHDLFFEADRTTPKLAALLLPCFAGKELRVYPLCLRRTRALVEGLLMLSAGRLD